MGILTRTRVSMIAAALLIFIAGAVSGGAFVRMRQTQWLREHLTSDPAYLRTELFLRALDARVSLDRNQKARAREILNAQATEYRAAIELARPRLRALRHEFARDLGPSLRPEQRAAIESMLHDIDSRR